MRPIEDADLDEHLYHNLDFSVSRPRYGRQLFEIKKKKKKKKKK